MVQGKNIVVRICVFLAALALARACYAADWPQWRGPDRAGVWRDVELPARLTEDRVSREWSVPIGGGFSGIAVVGDRVLTMDRSEGAPIEEVVCFSARDGGRLWAFKYGAEYGDMDHGNGPRATPTVDCGHIYAAGAMGRVSCLALENGHEIWSFDGRARFGGKIPTWGHSASPLVDGELVYVLGGGGVGATLVALERETGKVRWRALDDRPGYSSPRVIEIGGERQLLAWTADNLVALDPRTGEVLWSTPFRTSNFDVSIVSPIVHGGRVLVSGYWDGAAVLRLAGESSPTLEWKSRRPSCLMATPLFRDEHFYALDRREGLLCMRWADGEILWKDDHRLTPAGRNPHASLVWVAGGDEEDEQVSTAVALNASGELVLAGLSPSGFQERGRVKIIEGQKVWAHPAFVGQRVYARTDTELVCVIVLAEGSERASESQPASE